MHKKARNLKTCCTILGIIISRNGLRKREKPLAQSAASALQGCCISQHTLAAPSGWCSQHRCSVLEPAWKSWWWLEENLPGASRAERSEIPGGNLYESQQQRGFKRTSVYAVLCIGIEWSSYQTYVHTYRVYRVMCIYHLDEPICVLKRRDI